VSTPAFEAFLARLYTDEALLAAFLNEPEKTARAAGLDSVAVRSLGQIDRDGLAMAARSFRAKRKAPKPSIPATKSRSLRARIKSVLGAIDRIAQRVESGTPFKILRGRRSRQPGTTAPQNTRREET